MAVTVQTEMPDALWRQAQLFVQHGWAGNMQELMTESLRRYLESHHEALTEKYIMEDLAWGLRGHD